MSRQELPGPSPRRPRILDPGTWGNATANTWRSFFGVEILDPCTPEGLRVDADVAARELLGCLLDSEIGGRRVRGVVVETEAYLGPHDPASHAAERIGRTQRNQRMFGPAGTAYVYRSYGVHWCLNVVTGMEGYPAAVLIRGVDPIQGRDAVRCRRGGKEPLGAGPGRVCQALGVTGGMDGHNLSLPPLRLLRGWTVPDSSVGVSGRVGIRHAADWPLRFYLHGHPQVTRISSRARGSYSRTESNRP